MQRQQILGDQPYVEVEIAPQKFEHRDIQTGLSDGIQIEVEPGLAESDEVRDPNLDAQPAAKIGRC
ncbi:MAG: hypothetical protein U0X73_07835 [Thermoanaerobaculia bacterium]